MGRHNRRTVASFVTAASVLAVLFAAFFAVSDVLPIPDSLREIVGLASADTTDVGELSSGSDPTTSTADPQTSIETTQVGEPPSESTPSVESSSTIGVPSEEPSATADLADTAQHEPAAGSGEGSGSSDGSGATPATPAVVATSGPSVQAGDVTPPAFPTGALLVFRYPTASGFTVGYTRAEDTDTGVEYYDLVIEQIPALGSATVLSSTAASTTADEYVASGLTAGAYRVSVTAVDGDDNVSDPLVGEVLVGHDRPQVLVAFLDPAIQAAVAAGHWINWGSAVQLDVAVTTEAPFYKIHSTDLLGATAVTASIESSTTTSTVVSIGGEGQATVSVTAVDCYGLESTPTAIALRVDRTAPTAVTLLRARQPIGTDELRVSWARSLDLTSGLSHYIIEVTDADGEIVRRVRRSYLTNPYYRFVDLDYGYYDVTVTPVDVAGNEGAGVQISTELSEETAEAGATSGGSSWSGGSAGGSGSVDDGDSGSAPGGSPTTPATPAAEEPTDGGSVPVPSIDTKINDSNRLYWLIGAAGFGIGLLMIYFTAVHRAFSKKDD